MSNFDPIINLAKRRGFVFPSAEIYGGLGGVWDWGPLGTLLKKRIQAAWWRAMIQERLDIVPIDSAILTKAEVLEASGHVANFTDPLVECHACQMRYRADKEPFNLPANLKSLTTEQAAQLAAIACPNCQVHDWLPPRRFQMMFETQLGAVAGSSATVYLRPETAQGMFVNFKTILETTRLKLPFGIAQIGKGFRNEIQTGNFIFRSREFEMMECEYFVNPEHSRAAHHQMVSDRLRWYTEVLGLPADKLRLRDHADDERAHYAVASTDIEYDFPGLGFAEIEGIAHRGDYDLTCHQTASGKDLRYFDQATGEHFLPHVIEPAAGLDRVTLAVLCQAYREYPGGRQQSTEQSADVAAAKEPSATEIETVLHLAKQLAPYQVAVLPLSKKPELLELTDQIIHALMADFQVTTDHSGSIGRRYRRQDEIGTPWCLTVDFQSLTDKSVTVRDRDTMTQVRLLVDELPSYLSKLLRGLTFSPKRRINS